MPALSLGVQTRVSWCADQSGYIEQGIIPKYSLCSDGVDWFKKNNQWQDRNATPSTGAIIFFDWDGDGIIDHTLLKISRMIGFVQFAD